MFRTFATILFGVKRKDTPDTKAQCTFLLEKLAAELLKATSSLRGLHQEAEFQEADEILSELRRKAETGGICSFAYGPCGACSTGPSRAK